MEEINNNLFVWLKKVPNYKYYTRKLLTAWKLLPARIVLESY